MDKSVDMVVGKIGNLEDSRTLVADSSDTVVAFVGTTDMALVVTLTADTHHKAVDTVHIDLLVFPEIELPFADTIDQFVDKVERVVDMVDCSHHSIDTDFEDTNHVRAQIVRVLRHFV